MRNIIDATGMDRKWMAPVDGSSDGRPGYAFRRILGAAPIRQDKVLGNILDPRPIFPHMTGGPYNDPMATLEGTKPIYTSQRKGADTLTRIEWNHRLKVNGW